MKKTIMIFTLLIALLGVVNAQDLTRRADNREMTQQSRIHEGRKNGELTNREASALNTQQRSVRRAERRAKADGDVTPREKARIERKQDRASRHIRKAKHNDIDKN